MFRKTMVMNNRPWELRMVHHYLKEEVVAIIILIP